MYPISRAEQLWKNWEENQKQLQSLSDVSLTDRNLLRFKYDFLSNGLYRLSSTPSEREKLHLHVIRTVVSKLQRQLFPNPIVRLMHRLRTAIFDKPMHLKQFNRQKLENLDRIKEQLKQSGLSSISGKLESYLDFESTVVNIPVLGGLGENGKIDVNLNFVKDKVGSYQFNHFKASLLQDKLDNISSTFPISSGINIKEAVQLLQGRAVMKEQEAMDGSLMRKWVQLNQHKDGLASEVQLVDYSVTSTFDLKKTLLEHATQLDDYRLAKDTVIKELEKGNLVSFDIRGLGTYSMLANPAGGKVNFYDSKNNAVGFDKVVESLKAKNAVRPNDVKMLPTEKKEQKHGLRTVR